MSRGRRLNRKHKEKVKWARKGTQQKKKKGVKVKFPPGSWRMRVVRRACARGLLPISIIPLSDDDHRGPRLIWVHATDEKYTVEKNNNPRAVITSWCCLDGKILDPKLEFPL